MPIILTPKQVTAENKKQLGGKAEKLAELIYAGFPVPECFFITTEAFDKFLIANNLRSKINEIIKNIDFTNMQSLIGSSKSISELIIKSEIPFEIKRQIELAYRYLSSSSSVLKHIGMNGSAFVIIRSSGISEDSKTASSAGQYETFLNIIGEYSVVEHVKKCWASLYTPRVIYYRHKNNQPQDSSLCVIIQKMINSEKSGVTFTIDPSNPEKGKNKIITESCWGLGETLVQGQVEPDRYIVHKETGEILDKKIGNKLIYKTRDKDGKTIELPVPSEKTSQQVLSDEAIVALSAVCKKIEQHYDHPQDIEWCTEKGNLYIVQTRPVTVLKQKQFEEVSGKIILQGLGASPGIATGKVKIIQSILESDKLQQGDILVTKMTSPDFVPLMEKSSAIITDQGGSTCHAAIVSRELGIPCIVGAKIATQILNNNQIITVDAVSGKVFEGKQEISSSEVQHIDLHTATEIKVNLAFPETSQKAVHADGIGLFRLEHLLVKSGKHPLKIIQENPNELTEIIEHGLKEITEIFKDKPIWVRLLDMRTDEYRNLEGGESEPLESNPMLGLHGIRKDLKNEQLLASELRAIKNLHKQNLNNIHIMLPFIYDVSELERFKEFCSKLNFPDSVKIGIMVEIPSAAIMIEKFCESGIDFISIGSNDLTQLTLGIDRNNEQISQMFNEMHPAMKRLFKRIIITCKRFNVQTSICGELPSNSKKAVEYLIRLGIDSLSVNIDAIDKVRQWAYKAERKILLEEKR